MMRERKDIRRGNTAGLCTPQSFELPNQTKCRHEEGSGECISKPLAAREPGSLPEYGDFRLIAIDQEMSILMNGSPTLTFGRVLGVDGYTSTQGLSEEDHASNGRITHRKLDETKTYIRFEEPPDVGDGTISQAKPVAFRGCHLVRRRQFGFTDLIDRRIATWQGLAQMLFSSTYHLQSCWNVPTSCAKAGPKSAISLRK